MSDEYGTYGITGIPPPKNVKYLTKTIPYAAGMPVRKEISKLASPRNQEGQDQWTLFVLALEKFKAMSVEKKLSYFQVAGIHSYPLATWDMGKPVPHDKYYCTHNDVTFSTWHRVYMLLFEQLIHKNAVEIVKEWDLSDAENERWMKAADTLRLPYWDWAHKQKYTDNFAVPYVLTTHTVEIFPPQGVKLKDGAPSAYPNPLYEFENPEVYADGDRKGDPRPFGNMPEKMRLWNVTDHKSYPWSKASGTSRYGIKIKPSGKYSGLDGVNNFAAANTTISSLGQPSTWDDNEEYNPGTLSDAVNRLFAYNSTWGTFASTKWNSDDVGDLAPHPIEDPQNYLSLEFIHNNMHVATGGQDLNLAGLGHMSDVPVAAFDPIFWLHHCQIDRLLAMWQALNWDLWWDKPEPKPEHPDPKHPIVPEAQPNDPLEPFHTKTDGDPNVDIWTSTGCRDWIKLGYQYDNLQAQPGALNADGTLNEDQYKLDLEASIHKTYPSTAHLVRKLRVDKRDSKIVAVPRGIPEEIGKSFDDYVINVIYDRYALGSTSYAIRFYLGGPKEKKKTNYIKENHVGEVFTFTGPLPTSESEPGCSNCKKQADAGVLSQAQVPITIQLINHVFSEDKDHPIKNFEHVDDYLGLHLNWKFVELGGAVRDASEFPKTKITVMRGKAKPRSQPVVPPESASAAESASGEAVSEPEQVILPPHFYDYKPVYDATEGKNWGACRPAT